MTSLLPTSTRPGPPEQRPRPPRPLVLSALTAGAAAAGATLLVLMALAVVGWFLTDGGVHGSPSGALRVGTLGWLAGHGSGVRVDGAAVTVVPLGVTALCGWAVWRFAGRVGRLTSGQGPDAEELGDGERDWTVPVAVGVFTAGYVVVTTIAATLAATPTTSPSLPRAVLWSLLLCLGLAGPAVALHSGRAAIWVGLVPETVRAALVVTRRLLSLWLALAALLLLGALALDWSTAANVMAQLHTDPGAIVLIVLGGVLLLPNAVVFAGSFLLGPGFGVGAGTVVSPAVTVLGPLPMFPLLAALPDDGAAPAWGPWLALLPPLLAAAVVMWSQRRHPSTRWDDGALRGLVGGVLAGLVCGLAAVAAGGAAGPGRMGQVGPFALEVTVHAVTAFGLGGLLGGLVATWWQRRTAPGEPAETEPAAQ